METRALWLLALLSPATVLGWSDADYEKAFDYIRGKTYYISSGQRRGNCYKLTIRQTLKQSIGSSTFECNRDMAWDDFFYPQADLGDWDSTKGAIQKYTRGTFCDVIDARRESTVEIVLTSSESTSVRLEVKEPRTCKYEVTIVGGPNAFGLDEPTENSPPPSPSPSASPAPVMKVESTQTQESSGGDAAAAGGISGGVVGGLLFLGLLLYAWFHPEKVRACLTAVQAKVKECCPQEEEKPAPRWSRRSK